jgi:hypothetical protein
LKLSLILILALALTPLGIAAAQEDESVPCAEGQVSGTVVAVDEETGTVTVDTGAEGLCTVTLKTDFAHPIVALLGTFFSEVSAESLAAALEATQVWVVCDEDGVCTLASEDDEDAVAATVVSMTKNEDGTFTLELAIEGQEQPVTVMTNPEDTELADDLAKALDTLTVEWTLQEGEDGTPSVVDAGDQIADLHEDGLGFGVIVKFFAMAAESQEACADEEPSGDEPCSVTVDELVEAFQSGMGMGQLFQEFGRPSMLGVGHVRKALNGETEAGETELTGAAKGICNARAQGDQANGKGHGDLNCPDTDDPTTSGEQLEADQAQPHGAGGQGNEHGGGNSGGKGGGEDRDKRDHKGGGHK